MIVEVARSTGRAVAAVAHDSYALTLWSFLHMQEAERMQSVIRLGHRVEMAIMVARAFNDPKSLRQDELRYQEAAGMLMRPDEARVRGMDLIAQVAQIDACEQAKRAAADAATAECTAETTSAATADSTTEGDS